MKSVKAMRYSLPLAVALAACHHEPHAVSPTPPAWLEGVTLDLARQNAPDAQQVGGIRKAVAYNEDDRTDWSVPLERGSCYWFSLAGDQNVEAVGLFLWNPRGSRLETVKQQGPRAVLAHCASAPGLYKLQAKIMRGYGHYELAVFTTAAPGTKPAPAPIPSIEAEMEPPPAMPPAPPAVPPAPPAPAPAVDLAADIDAAAKTEAPQASRVGELFDGKSNQTDWYIQLDADKCYWLVAAGEPSVKGLPSRLWVPQDKGITANKSQTTRGGVGHCPAVSGRYHFQAKVAEGSGKYQVGVYARAK